MNRLFRRWLRKGGAAPVGGPTVALPREVWKVWRRALREKLALDIREVDVCLRCSHPLVADPSSGQYRCACRSLVIPVAGGTRS